MKQLFKSIATVGEYLNISQQLSNVQGFLTDLEGFTLMKLAAEGPGQGAIVEIGSLFGRSTCWLAYGSLAAGREPVHAVDHFKGSPEHQTGAPFELDDIAEKGTTFFTFMENIKNFGVNAHVRPIASSSLKAAKAWDGGPIRLLFIDGDHSFEPTLADFNAWAPFVTPGGIIVFHDTQIIGVHQAMDDIMNQGGYKEYITLDNMAAVQKEG